MTLALQQGKLSLARSPHGNGWGWDSSQVPGPKSLVLDQVPEYLLGGGSRGSLGPLCD